MRKLKNCYYKKVKDVDLIESVRQEYYFVIYDKNKNYVASVLNWATVLTYNKYGVINE